MKTKYKVGDSVIFSSGKDPSIHKIEKVITSKTSNHIYYKLRGDNHNIYKASELKKGVATNMKNKYKIGDVVFYKGKEPKDVYFVIASFSTSEAYLDLDNYLILGKMLSKPDHFAILAGVSTDEVRSATTKDYHTLPMNIANVAYSKSDGTIAITLEKWEAKSLINAAFDKFKKETAIKDDKYAMAKLNSIIQDNLNRAYGGIDDNTVGNYKEEEPLEDDAEDDAEDDTEDTETPITKPIGEGGCDGCEIIASTAEEQLISATCLDLTATLIKKNRDYGNSFGKTFQELGPITGLTRFLDKANRIKNLTKKAGTHEVSDESLLDTWKDAAGYAILNYINLKKLIDGADWKNK